MPRHGFQNFWVLASRAAWRTFVLAAPVSEHSAQAAVRIQSFTRRATWRRLWLVPALLVALPFAWTSLTNFELQRWQQRLLQSPEPNVRVLAARRLSFYPPEPRVLESLALGLRDTNPAVRDEVSQVLIEFGDVSLHALLGGLRAIDEEARLSTIGALDVLASNTEDPAVLDKLAKRLAPHLADSSQAVRSQAWVTLLKCGPTALGHLQNAFEDFPSRMEEKTVYLLRYWSPQEEILPFLEHLETLVQIADSPEAAKTSLVWRRHVLAPTAASVLAQLGPAGQAILESLATRSELLSSTLAQEALDAKAFRREAHERSP